MKIKFVLLFCSPELLRKLNCKDWKEMLDIIGVLGFEIVDDAKFAKFMLQFPEHIIKTGYTKEEVTTFTIKT